MTEKSGSVLVVGAGIAGMQAALDLANALKKMGAGIAGAGSSIIEVSGAECLGGYDHEVIADRIEAGTYIIAAAITGGNILVIRANPDHPRISKG